MMKKLLLPALLLFVAGSVSAQHIIRSDEIGRFHSIILTGNITAEVVPSDSNRLEISLFDVATNRFKWTLRDGVLSASVDTGQRSMGRAEITIYCADTLLSVWVSGSDLTMRGELSGEKFDIGVNGGGRLSARLDLFDLDVSVTGNSRAELSGTTKYLTLRATEKSRVDALALESIAADVDAATGAEATICVRERLVVDTKSASTIFYKGRPRIIRDRSSRMNKDVMGAGIRNIGE